MTFHHISDHWLFRGPPRYWPIAWMAWLISKWPGKPAVIVNAEIEGTVIFNNPGSIILNTDFTSKEES